MASHDLEVSVIVDLDVDRGSISRGRKRNRSTWTDIGKEAVSVPRCLPLGFASSANVGDEAERRGRSCDIPHPRYSATRRAVCK